MKTKHKVALTVASAVALTGGLVTGTAFAGVGIFQAPWGVAASDGQQAPAMPAPNYQKNAKGLSYGSAADAPSSSAEPDLIQVLATNGKEGYAYKSDLDEATGESAIATFKSPNDALKWQASHKDRATAVKVYDLDGSKIIGEFVVLPSNATSK